MIKFLKVLLRRKIAFGGLVVLIVIFLMAVFSPLMAPYDPMELNTIDRLQPPNTQYWFGTDNFGRDIFSRIVYGARMSIISGSGVVFFSVLLGILIGVLSAYFKRIEIVMMRLVDVLMAFPPLLLALVLMAILGRGLVNVIIAVGATYLTTTARIIYGLTLKVKEETYIEAVLAAGASHFLIIRKHILPNLISPIMVQATFTFAFSLLQMSALDFLGLGVPPDIPSWGYMLSVGRMYITRAPWILIFPGSFIVLIVLSFNLVGDVLRDQLDPRFRSEIEGV